MPTADRSLLLEKVRRLPHAPGVYLLRDRLGSVLYVGKAKDLRKRVSTYFQNSRSRRDAQPKVSAMVGLIHDLECIELRSEPEALLLEGRLIKEYRPKYNTVFTDDKRFLLIRLDTRPALPRFRLARFEADDRSRYFGPFPHSSLVRRTLAEMRRKFGILLSDASPSALEDGRWRLYQDVRAEIYGHPNIVSSEEYAERVEIACRYLEGRSREWLEEIRQSMTTAAEARDYEKAAELRDTLQALEKTLTPSRRFSRALLPRRDDDADACGALAEALALPSPPVVIEGFDISHISGTFCVASMVRFVRGHPDRSGYRRYRIQGSVGNDDFRAMEEVVGRRYRRLREEGRPMPDLILIDGGRGQMSAASRAFFALDLQPPAMVGLAKREETLLFPDERPPLSLPRDHPGLRLLQRLRDEAHRFANTYNAEWRSRVLRTSFLEDFPGLGPVRRAALLERFPTREALRKASLADLQEVAGIGPGLAQSILDQLRQPNPDLSKPVGGGASD